VFEKQNSLFVAIVGGLSQKALRGVAIEDKINRLKLKKICLVAQKIT
jgi:hypothetical protein